ncbi:hypothetical protein SAMN06269185_1206 [Natronoarchaeum philippinense]|uniref:Uncharacterized protein n=1 Tax=Natronoarchaeum philippinense TaxID=558529 RepID=A0A285NAM5_NATPI|nr:hypothetical protein [Natronoarchaeum philippinense]SNZ06544.1 hypothetical protein SAMN06269185_1206 [Natronoarchaeum philippinense]
MDLEEAGRRAAAYDSVLGAVLVVVYLLTVTVVGGALAGDPTATTPIVSDAVALVLVLDAYRRDRLWGLGVSLVVALILLAWALAALPAVGADAAAALPGWLVGDSGKPLALAGALVVGDALVRRGVVPTPGTSRG